MSRHRAAGLFALMWFMFSCAARHSPLPSGPREDPASMPARASAPGSAPVELGADSAAGKRLVAFIDAGQLRPVSARGYAIQLPDSAQQLVRDHPALALRLLKERLRSSHPHDRLNACDFMTSLLELPAHREEAAAILLEAVRTEGFVFRQYLQYPLRRAGFEVGPPPARPATTRATRPAAP